MKTYSNLPKEHEDLHFVHCVLCGALDHRFLYDIAGARFMKCSECGMVFQNPMPINRELLKRYDKEYFFYELENEISFFNLMLLGLKDIGFSSLKFPNTDKTQFLDIGCATGKLLEYLRDEKGLSVYGVEVCGESVEYGRENRNLRIFHGTLQQAGFPGEIFDVVHASHVIEHIGDPAAFMEEIRRILKPGGYAIISTPNIDGFQSKIFNERWRSAIPDHMVLFSKRTLARLFNHTGFQVLKTKTWGGLAAGAAPPFLKKIFDKLAKRLGLGDVMIFLAGK